MRWQSVFVPKDGCPCYECRMSVDPKDLDLWIHETEKRVRRLTGIVRTGVAVVSLSVAVIALIAAF